MRFIKNFVYDYLTTQYGFKKKDIKLRAERCGNSIWITVYVNIHGIPNHICALLIRLDELKLIDRDYHTVRRGRTCADKLRYRTVCIILNCFRHNLVSTLTTSYTNLKGE